MFYQENGLSPFFNILYHQFPLYAYFNICIRDGGEKQQSPRSTILCSLSLLVFVFLFFLFLFFVSTWDDVVPQKKMHRSREKSSNSDTCILRHLAQFDSNFHGATYSKDIDAKDHIWDVLKDFERTSKSIKVLVFFRAFTYGIGFFYGSYPFSKASFYCWRNGHFKKYRFLSKINIRPQIEIKWSLNFRALMPMLYMKNKMAEASLLPQKFFLGHSRVFLLDF